MTNIVLLTLLCRHNIVLFCIFYTIKIYYLFVVLNSSCSLQIAQFLDSHGFLDYIERGIGSDENNNLLDKLQDAIGRGQNPMSIFPSPVVEPEIITISDPGGKISGKFDLTVQ